VKQKRLRTLKIADSQHLRHISTAWQNFEYLTTLSLRYLLCLPGIDFGDISFPWSLKSLSMHHTLNDPQNSQIMKLLTNLPPLEHLELKSHLHFSDTTAPEIADYITASNSLLKLELVFSPFRNPELLESFLSRVAKSRIVSFSLRVLMPISVSAEMLFRFVRSAECLNRLMLSGFECPELDHDPNQPVELQQLVDSHPLLRSITVGRTAVSRTGYDRTKRCLDVKEIGPLIKFTRLLAGYKLSKPLRVPTEIILHIFKINALEAVPKNSPHLNLIMKCLADRCTLGKVRCEVVSADWAVLYSKCSRALKELE
jgi:hypothetical protein